MDMYVSIGILLLGISMLVWRKVIGTTLIKVNSLAFKDYPWPQWQEKGFQAGHRISVVVGGLFFTIVGLLLLLNNLP